ncbi:hypothetical protein RI543_000135 [Arxiozyma heterogenica]|uniref:Protein BIG1 n=1 Tax=Arxiozyma heterogenica TaxID=278026 RepID=A0AAN7ZZ36_9SACH|nr:hypothetical protein RI543_000135 [Kazachstania heterogenica]
MLSKFLLELWMTILLFKCVLGKFATNTVPAIMYSYSLAPGLIKYQKNYNYKQTVPIESFKIISEELLGNCNSDAYIFINIPGLNELDFVKYRDGFRFLESSFELSSTGLKFEKVKIDQSTFDYLIAFTKQKCQVSKILRLIGNDTTQYEPYLDTDKRIIGIDFPALDSIDDQVRSETINHFDNYLKYVLGQIPSPYQTVILTSLEPDLQADLSSGLSLLDHYDGFFNDIISRKRDLEKNNRILDVPIIRNKHKPLHQELHNHYVSIFDSDFIQNNYPLLKLIVTTTIIFIMYCLVFNRNIFTNGRNRPQKPSLSSLSKDGKKENDSDKINREERRKQETKGQETNNVKEKSKLE